MTDDIETWLIDTGDEVIQKRAVAGIIGLSEVEKAVYCLWVVDYAVRNSGTLQPMQEIYPGALVDLRSFAISADLSELAVLASDAEDEVAFCANYYSRFEAGGRELRQHYDQA